MGYHFYLYLLLASAAFVIVLDMSKQAVCAIEKLLVTTEVMAARPKPGGRLSQFLADFRLQKRQQGEMPIYTFQVHLWFCFRYRKYFKKQNIYNIELTICVYSLCHTQTVTLKGEVSKLAGDGTANTKLQRAMESTIETTTNI